MADETPDAQPEENVEDVTAPTDQELEEERKQLATRAFVDRFKVMAKVENTPSGFKQMPYLAEYSLSYLNGNVYAEQVVRELTLTEMVTEAMQTPDVDGSAVIDWYASVMVEFNKNENERLAKEKEDREAEQAAQAAQQAKVAELLARAEKLTSGGS